MDDRKCLQCHEQLRGRADQKFCSDQCRSTYNNIAYSNMNLVIKVINRILKKNYSILVSLNAMGKTTVKKSELMKKGYRFDHFTYVVVTHKNNANYYCYDHGFREKEDNKLVLVQRDMKEDVESYRN